MDEFWEICRVGERVDTRREVEEYLGDCETISGMRSDLIRGSQAFLDEVVDKVIEKRVGNENGDQIYAAILECMEYGRNKDGLFQEKSLTDMELEDFKDPERKKEFNGLEHQWRDLRRQLHEENMKPFGGNREKMALLKQQILKASCDMNLLRVKEWLAKQPYDLDTESAGHQEALEMLVEICGRSFPELAGMVFDGEDNDLIFREPHDSGLYVWAYHNPDANAGGQIVECSFGAADAARIAEAAVPAWVFDANHVYHSDVNKKEFFMTIFDMLKMKEDGHYLGRDLKEICRDIAGKSCERRVWHGDVDVPHAYSGLDEDGQRSLESAVEEFLRNCLESTGAFEDICLEKIGDYKDGVGYSFSFTANVDERAVGRLLQKALEGLKFEAWSDLLTQAPVAKLIEDAAQRSCDASQSDAGPRGKGQGDREGVIEF